MKRGGVHWVSVLAGVSVVVLAWLLFRGLAPTRKPQKPEPTSLIEKGKGEDLFSTKGGREKVASSPSLKPSQEEPDFRPFQLCLKDAITGTPIVGGEVVDNRSERVLGKTDGEGCITLKGLDPGMLLLHCRGYFLSLVPEPARVVARAGKRAEVALFPSSDAVFAEIQTRWPDQKIPPGRLRIRVDRFGPPSVGERSFPTARFGPGRQISPEARRAWEQHVLLASSIHLDEGWFLGGYGGISLPAKGGRIYFPHRGKFLVRARDDSGAYWAKATVEVRGKDPGLVLLQFRKGKALSFLVRDPHGKAVAGARLVLTFPLQEAGGRYENISDEDGSVLLQGVAETKGGKLQVFAPDYRVKTLELPVLPEKRTTIVMEPLPSEQVAFLIQEIRSHKPLKGVEVLVGNPAHPTQRTYSDSRGRVRIRLIPGQLRNLTFRKKGYLTYGELLEILPGAPPPRVFEMVPSDPEAQRRLGLVALIKGTIVNAQGKPFKGAPIYLAVEGEGFTRISNPMSRKIVRGALPKSVTQTHADEKGRFLLVAANGGKAKLIWGGESYQQKTFVVKAGQVLQFRLSR